MKIYKVKYEIRMIEEVAIGAKSREAAIRKAQRIFGRDVHITSVWEVDVVGREMKLNK